MNKNIIAIAVILIAGAMYPFFLEPLWEDVRQVSSQKDALTTAIQDAEEFVTVRDQLLLKRDQFSDSEIARVNALLPSEVDRIQTVLDLQQLALRNGLAVSDILSEASAGETEEFASLGVTLSLSGTYTELKNFLDGLSESLTLFEVTSLSFGRADEETGLVNFDLNIETSVYNG